MASADYFLEYAADRGWPSQRTATLGHWRLRWSPTKENRPRSALALPEDVDHLDRRVDEVENFYRAVDDCARFQILPGRTSASTTDLLLARDYVASDPSFTMVAPLPLAAMGVIGDGVTLEADLDADAWINRWAALTDETSASTRHLDVLRSIQDPAEFVAVQLDGAPAGLGRGVVSGGLLGIFNIFIPLALRRGGLGSAVVGALADWGVGHGARFAYLQVEAHNRAAIALYEKLGFRTAYRYHYLLHPSAVAVAVGVGVI